METPNDTAPPAKDAGSTISLLSDPGLNERRASPRLRRIRTQIMIATRHRPSKPPTSPPIRAALVEFSLSCQGVLLDFGLEENGKVVVVDADNVVDAEVDEAEKVVVVALLARWSSCKLYTVAPLMNKFDRPGLPVAAMVRLCSFVGSSPEG